MWGLGCDGWYVVWVGGVEAVSRDIEGFVFFASAWVGSAE